MTDVERAARAIESGELAVYPTETVYGLGANAVDAAAVERVFETKGRARENPVSLGVPSVERAREYTAPTERERAFMREFLPGPVTVVVERREAVPDVLTAGRDRVGVRIPDHDLALALYDAADVPVTATSANLSGAGSVRRVDDLDERVREAASVVLDGGEMEGGETEGGETGGVESTVVDVDAGTIHRRGAVAEEIEDWLSERV